MLTMLTMLTTLTILTILTILMLLTVRQVSRDKYDELGYIVLPPCLWGDDAGLDKPAWLPPNTPMFSIKRNYNTHAGHYGEMASWQMRGVGFSADQLRVTV